MIQTSTVRCGNASELMDEISAASVQQAEMISLVENGIRYNEPGGSVTVTVGREFAPIAPGSDDDATAPLPAAATLAAQAVIRVRDTGPGIPGPRR